ATASALRPAAKANYTIGIAPFARHREKTYPLALLKEVLALLQTDSRFSIQLVGGAGAEAAALSALEKEFTGVVSMAGRYSLAEELTFVGRLDLMVSMDSANMHLASLCNVPVVSIWGPTHRYAGFMGWGQPDDHAVEVSLDCRPCSVFGNKVCYRGDHACMQQIAPAVIATRIYTVLGLSMPGTTTRPAGAANATGH
ncbi:MAG: glycosyltransferase family 9 protein, partial [Sphingomonadales bacterium]